MNPEPQTLEEALFAIDELEYELRGIRSELGDLMSSLDEVQNELSYANDLIEELELQTPSYR